MTSALFQLRLESSHFNAAALQISRMTGREEISQLFEFHIDVSAATADALDPSQIVGAEACLVFERDGEQLRRLYGMIPSVEERFDLSEESSSGYRLRLVPRAHRLSLIKLQDIFMGYSAPKLIEHKLKTVGLADADADASSGLIKSYAQREFIVQFDETDLALVSRLAEHLGISFFFDHTQELDRIVFTDHNEGFPEAEQPLVLRERRGEGGIMELRATTTMIPEVYVMMDYNYRSPDVELTSSTTSSHGYAGGVVDWGDHFKSPNEGAELATIRSEERAATQYVFRGKSGIPQVASGHRYGLDGHARLDGKQLLVTRVDHSCSQPVLAHGNASEEFSYENAFTAIPADRPYRPPRRTPKPKISGLLTAIVEPKEYGEVDRYAIIDREGRYRLKFYFDTAGLDDRAAASRPVRKAEPAVGPDYGMHFPLRPGVEVLTAFVNGDPDRPIIVGAVHNARTPSHVIDRVSRTSTIKTASGIRMRFKDD